MGLDSQLSTRSTSMLCLIFFLNARVCVICFVTQACLQCFETWRPSARGRDRATDRARESDGGQMKGGTAARGGRASSSLQRGLEFPAAIRNGDRDGKRERPIHTVGFFPHLKSVYLYFSLWFLFCTCAFFCVCVKPIDSVFLKKLLRRLVRV